MSARCLYVGGHRKLEHRENHIFSLPLFCPIFMATYQPTMPDIKFQNTLDRDSSVHRRGPVILYMWASGI